MPNCCGSNACSCLVISGEGISVTGAGTAASPYTIIVTAVHDAVLSSAIPSALSVVPLAGSGISVSRSDHIHPAAGLYAFYGTGTAGDIVLDGTSTVAGFSRTGTVYTALSRVNAHDLVINSGVTLRPGGWTINVLGVLSGAGLIQAASGKTSVSRYAQLLPGAIGPAGGAGVGTAGLESGQFGPAGTSGSGGLGSGGAGGAGVFNNTQYVTDGYLTDVSRAAITALTGVTYTTDWAQTTPTMTVSTLQGGTSGGAGGGGGGNGGAGGDGGQVVIVNARQITGSINIQAPGGAGGAAVGTNAGGGGGGLGGIVILNYTTAVSYTGVLSAAGGVGGAKNGTGVVGSAGGAGFTRTNVWA